VAPALVVCRLERPRRRHWRHGSGPEVTGPAIALLLAMAGRKTALDDLTGPGVALLRSRI